MHHAEQWRIKTMATANDVALSLLREKDFKSAFDFIKPKDAPQEVSSLKETDNIIGMCYKKSGVGYLKWCERLEQAACDNRPIYRICNDEQGTFILPQYDHLRDVTNAVVEGEEGKTYCKLKTLDIQKALSGLYGQEGLSYADRRDLISFVFPHIYLTGQRRKNSLINKGAGTFNVRTREINKYIELFQERISRLTRMEAALKTRSTLFAFSGWFHLLYDIKRGYDFPFEDGDSVLLKCLKIQAQNVNPSYVDSLLNHARLTMTPEELRYNWPDELK